MSQEEIAAAEAAAAQEAEATAAAEAAAKAAEEAPEEETAEELKARLAKAEELANNYKVRAEKAEKKAKEAPSEAPSGLSLADSHALLKADVHEDDIERVEKFAKLEGVSIKEALKNPELKAILGVRAEQRTTAQAANVSPARRGSTKVSEETLLANARAGKLPESDEDIQRLVAAEAAARKG